MCSVVVDTLNIFFKISMIEWSKHDDKMLDYVLNNEENKLR